MSSQKKLYLRSRPSSSCPLKDATCFFSCSRSAARLLLLLAAVSVLGESDDTQQSNNEPYVLRNLESRILKIRHKCGLFTSEEAAAFKNNIDTVVASILEALKYNVWQMGELGKSLDRYNFEMQLMKEKYDQEIHGIKMSNALTQELMLVKIESARCEGQMFIAKADETILNQKVIMEKLDKMRKKRKKRIKMSNSGISSSGT